MVGWRLTAKRTTNTPTKTASQPKTDRWLDNQTCQARYPCPGQIKRREVSWTLVKKLDTFSGQGEIKRREVVLDPQVSPKEIKSRKVELGSESWTSVNCYSTAVLRTLSL